MILDAENRFVLVPHSFNCLVVEIDAIHGDFGRQTFRVHGKPMILRSDFHSAGFKILDGLIGPPVAKLEFEGFPSKSLSQDLMAEANPEDWDTALHEIVDGLNRIA